MMDNLAINAAFEIWDNKIPPTLDTLLERSEKVTTLSEQYAAEKFSGKLWRDVTPETLNLVDFPFGELSGQARCYYFMSYVKAAVDGSDVFANIEFVDYLKSQLDSDILLLDADAKSALLDCLAALCPLLKAQAETIEADFFSDYLGQSRTIMAGVAHIHSLVQRS